jgi:hypothetical protein
LIKRVIGMQMDWVLLPDRSKVYLKPGYMWLEGDNHAASGDSREFGPVPMGLLEGRVEAIIWPRFSRLMRTDVSARRVQSFLQK